ncbi:MAG: 4-(cytidine 5'-diphospho)-2-C-methyl-D-erythritol kinase [Longimicrobiales bacterium]|nr:4-(cytidine 5'-diphospho)-2-C-methyl-D-erythritol kinase [Longimicrobiales bacterium]
MNPGVAEVEAPAKVNLFLRVLHRRPDGFHELETLFQAVSLSDRVRVAVDDRAGMAAVASTAGGGGISLSVDGPDLGPVESNLAYRAASSFREAAGFEAPVRIELTKRIPAGAGLGGGSSDAAAVLRCLATLTGFPDADVLRAIALELGSDVPFFLSTSPLALGRGRGEELTELPPLPEVSLVLALPDVHVATGAAYGALASSRGSDAASSKRGGIGVVVGGDPSLLSSWNSVIESAVNDFEAVVVPAHSEVEASLRGLRDRGARVALLSGSGAASFGLFDSYDEARAAAAWLEGRHPWRFVPVTTRTTMPIPTVIRDGGPTGGP